MLALLLAIAGFFYVGALNRYAMMPLYAFPTPPYQIRVNQVALAKKLKRSQTFVARMESSRRRIDVIEFLDLAEAIGFDAVELLEALAQVPHGRAKRDDRG
jgi:HTH-type transcriptional regulator/antitoxin HipB